MADNRRFEAAAVIGRWAALGSRKLAGEAGAGVPEGVGLWASLGKKFRGN